MFTILQNKITRDSMRAAIQADQKICPYCEHEYFSLDAKFCPKCGQELVKAIELESQRQETNRIFNEQEEDRQAHEPNRQVKAKRRASALQSTLFHRHKVILILAAILYFTTMLLAPWVAKGTAGALSVLTQDGALMKYGIIFYPPECKYTEVCHYELDTSLLLIEWALIAIAMAIAWLWNKDEK